MAERKYAMIRIAAGDYLLPSNDGKTLFRIHTYIEGPSSGLADRYSADRTFWALKKWRRQISPEVLEFSPPNPDDWDEWEHLDEWFATRKEAISAALKAS